MYFQWFSLLPFFLVPLSCVTAGVNDKLANKNISVEESCAGREIFNTTMLHSGELNINVTTKTSLEYFTSDNRSLKMAISSLPVSKSLNLILILLIVTFVYKAVSTQVRKKLQASLTALDDVPLLALQRKDGRKIRGTAVICGGRVCSDHFEKVIIVEPEEWVATAEGLTDRHHDGLSAVPPPPKCSRVAQYTTVHAYQVFTPIALRKLFPNFDLEMQKSGARFVVSNQVHWSGFPIPAPLHLYPDGTIPKTMFLSRPAYETALRRLVMTCPNVKYVTGTVSGLVPQDATADVIASVRMRSRDEEETTVPAALVVDCTGPALGGLRWLQEVSTRVNGQTKGEKAPFRFEDLKATYNPKMAYSTVEFDVPPRLFGRVKDLGFPGDYETSALEYVNFPDPAKDSKTFAIVRREHNFLQFMCGGWDEHKRMTCIGDIKTFASQVVSEGPNPNSKWIQPLLDLFEEEKVPVTYVHARAPPSVYVQYHRAEKLPINFIAIGDSVLQLNPIRGHVCTKACVEAVTLNTLLSRRPQSDVLPKDIGRTFFSVQARRTGSLWDTYRSEDYAWKTTIPAKDDDMQTFGAWKRAYGSAFIRLMLTDRDVSAVWWHVIQWLAPPTDMFSPVILMKIGWMRMEGVLGLR